MQSNPQDLYHRIIWNARDYHWAQSMMVAAKLKVVDFQVKHISWKPPPGDWIKINLDGSVFNNNNAACGGLIRDHQGRFLFGFSANLGLCTITFAELWGMYFGMKIAHWERGLLFVPPFNTDIQTLTQRVRKKIMREKEKARGQRREIEREGVYY